MTAFTRPCPCKTQVAPLTNVCGACGDTGIVDVLDRLFHAIDQAGEGLAATVGILMVDAQQLANECAAIRSQEWMQLT